MATTPDPDAGLTALLPPPDPDAGLTALLATLPDPDAGLTALLATLPDPAAGRLDSPGTKRNQVRSRTLVTSIKCKHSLYNFCLSAAIFHTD